MGPEQFRLYQCKLLTWHMLLSRAGKVEGLPKAGTSPLPLFLPQLTHFPSVSGLCALQHVLETQEGRHRLCNETGSGSVPCIPCHSVLTAPSITTSPWSQLPLPSLPNCVPSPAGVTPKHSSRCDQSCLSLSWGHPGHCGDNQTAS